MYHAQTMYNIKEAAARAGVTIPVLRAWERRYGIVSPARTAGGYRLFDEATVARIRAMRSMVESGWSPSAAAAAILAGSAPPPIAVDTGAAPRPVAGVEPGGRADDEAAAVAEIVGRFVAAAGSIQPDAMDAVLDDLFSRGSFERVVTDLLFPALGAMGDAWEAGKLGIASEHFASSAVQRRLGQALESAGGGEGPGHRIVVGLPPGSRHELASLAFAVAARRAGMAVTYLGPDLPNDDWVTASADAAAVVIGVATPRDRSAAAEVARRVGEAHPGVVIAFGGPSAQPLPRTLRLPGPLSEAVAALNKTVVAGQTGPWRADALI